MKTTQQGVSIMALIIGLVIFIIVALFGMKVLPSYMEYRAAKGAVEVIAKQPNASVADIKKAFEARSLIDGINSIKPNDLEITKEGNDVVVGFAYRKEVPLFGPVGLYIDYAANSKE